MFVHFHNILGLVLIYNIMFSSLGKLSFRKVCHFIWWLCFLPGTPSSPWWHPLLCLWGWRVFIYSLRRTSDIRTFGSLESKHGSDFHFKVRSSSSIKILSKFGLNSPVINNCITRAKIILHCERMKTSSGMYVDTFLSSFPLRKLRKSFHERLGREGPE